MRALKQSRTSSGSTSTTPELPHASSWAAPPEFYIDENMHGRSLRRCIVDRGYQVHSPASVFTRERLEQGLTDEDWLPVIGEKGWVVFGRDQNILKRELELQAFLKAKVHMFLFPGDATRDHIIELVRLNLAQICALASARRPNVYWLRRDSVISYEERRADIHRRRP
ncbi:PIN-like domain-containing protein [Micromonospora aurantiaca (nom. illeg.)]|uniref:PIN-like domain-containing protein n=1 Tax=Micromonospora aurantiaca (nom. illeg.) TaxID=47850 RepID=UPI0036CBEBBF